MPRKVDSIFLASFIFQTLDKAKPQKELGVIEGTIIIGTKTFQKLQEGFFLYGTWIYSDNGLPDGRIDMDSGSVEPFCSLMEWHYINGDIPSCPTTPMHTSIPEVEKEETFVSKCATLITNAEECADVEWN